jgi:hypothetical protein
LINSILSSINLNNTIDDISKQLLNTSSGLKSGELKSIHSDGSGYVKTTQFENTDQYFAYQYIYDYQFQRYKHDHTLQWQFNMVNNSQDLLEPAILSQSEKYVIISNNSQNLIEEWYDPSIRTIMNYSWNFDVYNNMNGQLQKNISIKLQRTLPNSDPENPIFHGFIQLLQKGLIVGKKFIVPELTAFEYTDGGRPVTYFSILQVDLETNSTSRMMRFQIIDRIEFDYSLQLNAESNQVSLIVSYNTPIQYSGKGFAFDRFIEHHKIVVTQTDHLSSSGWSEAKSRCQHRDCHGFFDGTSSTYFFYEQVEEDNWIIDKYTENGTLSKNVIIPENYQINFKKYLFISKDKVIFPGEVWYEDESKEWKELDLFMLSLGTKYKIERLFLLPNRELDLRSITDLLWIGEDIGIAMNGRRNINNAESSVHEVFIVSRDVFNIQNTVNKYPFIPNAVITLIALVPILVRFPKQKGEITQDQYPSHDNSTEKY